MAGEKTAGKMALSTPVKVAAGVVLGALLIIVASKMMRMRQRNYSPQVIQQIESLARYAQANSAMAGQDTHLVISLMHVTKALTSAEVARRLVDLFLTSFDPALNTGVKAKATTARVAAIVASMPCCSVECVHSAMRVGHRLLPLQMRLCKGLVRRDQSTSPMAMSCCSLERCGSTTH